MSADRQHIVKLVVGIDSLRDFALWQSRERVHFQGQMANVIYTRNTPKDAENILAQGGSAYRVIKGVVRCRQKILGFDSAQTSSGTKCVILMDTDIIRTYPTPKRAFQGWRYLKAADTPADMGPYDASDDDGSDSLCEELHAAGLL